MPIDNAVLSMKVGYICPCCNKKVEKELPFINGDRNKIPHTVGWWCNYQYCDARHRLQYSVRHSEGEKPELKIEKFTSNEEVCNKRFQVLEWSGMESATKKGKKK